MDEFKKKLQSQQLLLVSGLLGACSAVLLTRNYAKEVLTSVYLQGFIEGFQVGSIVALFGALIFFIIRNIIAIKNPERLKKLYISETDERKLLIKQKSGSVGMNIIMYGLAAGTAISGNINDIVFFSLLGACMFVTLVRVSLKLYYRNKY